MTKKKCRVLDFLKPTSYFIKQINVIRHAEAKQRIKPKVREGEPQTLIRNRRKELPADGAGL